MPDNKQTPWWKKGLENQPLSSFNQALKAPTVQGLLGAKASSPVNKPVEKNVVSPGMKKALQAIDKATGGAWRDAPDSKKVWKYLYLKDQKGGITPEHVGKATTAILQAREAALKTDVTKAEREKYGTAVKPEVKELGLQNATLPGGDALDTQGVINLLRTPPADRNMIPVAKINGKDVSYTKFYDIVKRRAGMLPERWAQEWESEVKYRNQADEAKRNVDVTTAENPRTTLLGNVAGAAVHFTENPLAPLGVKGNPMTWARTAVGGVARAKGNEEIDAAISQVEKEQARKFTEEERAHVFAQMEDLLSKKQSVAEYGTDALSLLVPLGAMGAAGRLAAGEALGTAGKILSKVPTNTGQIANKILASKAGEIPLLAKGTELVSKAVPDLVTTPFLAQQGATLLDAAAALSGDERSLERTGQVLDSLKNPLNLALTSLGIYGGISAYRHNASVLDLGKAERALAKDAPLIQKRMENIQTVGGVLGVNGKTVSQIVKETSIPAEDVKQILATLSEGEGAVFEKTKNGRYRTKATPEDVTVQPAAETPVEGPSVPRTDELAPDASRNTPTEVEAPRIATTPDGLPHPTEFSKNVGDKGFLERARDAAAAALAKAEAEAQGNVLPTPRGKGRRGSKISWTKELNVVRLRGIHFALDLAVEMGGAAHVSYTKWAERMKPHIPEGASLPGLWRVVRKSIGLESGASKSSVQSVLQTVSGKTVDTDAIAKFFGYDITKGKSLTLEQMETYGAKLERALGGEAFNNLVDNIVAKAKVGGTTLSTEDQVSLIYGMRRQADIVRDFAKGALSGQKKDIELYEKADAKLNEILQANRAVGTAASSAFRARRLELTAKDRAVRHKVQVTRKVKRALTPEESVAIDDLHTAYDSVNAEVKSAMSRKAYKRMSDYVEYKGKLPSEELQTAEQAATLERLRREYLESVNKAHINPLTAIPAGMRYASNIMWEKLKGGSTLERAVSAAIDEAYAAGMHLDEEDILAEFVARGLDNGSYEAATSAQRILEKQLVDLDAETVGIIQQAASAMQNAEHVSRGDIPLGERLAVRETVRQMTDEQFLALMQKKAQIAAELQQPKLFTGKIDPDTGEVYATRNIVETTPKQAAAIKLFQSKLNALRKRINTEDNLTRFIDEEIGNGADPELVKMLSEIDILSADIEDLAPILNMFRKRKRLLEMDTDEILRNRATSPELSPEAKVVADRLTEEIKKLQEIRNVEMRISKLVMDGQLDPDIAKAMSHSEAKDFADKVDRIKRIQEDISAIESGKKDLKSGPENAKFIDEQVWGALQHRRKVISEMRNIERDIARKDMLRLMGNVRQGKVQDFLKGGSRYIGYSADLAMDFVRSSVASLDMSALFTQGGKAFLNPFFFKPWAEAAIKSGWAMWSESNALRYQAEMENTRTWAVAEQAGLHIRRDSDVLAKGMGEDIFSESAMNWLRHQGMKADIRKPGSWGAALGGIYAIPIIASARSMDVFSNSIRTRLFEQLAGGKEALAKVKPGSDIEHLKEIADFVNNLTGRATGPNASKIASQLNRVLFSGNYTLSAPQAYVVQPALGIGGFAKDIGKSIEQGSWTPIRKKAALHAARVSTVVAPIATLAMINQVLEISGAGYVDLDPHSNKFLKVKYWGSGDPNEGVTIDLTPQFGQLLRATLGLTSPYTTSDMGVQYFDNNFSGGTKLKKAVDADATRQTEGYKAYIAEMRRRAGDPTYDIFDEDGKVVRRFDKSKVDLVHKQLEENRFPNSDSGLQNAAKILFVWKLNPVAKYSKGLTETMLGQAFGPGDVPKMSVSDVFPLREALPIAAQNAWDMVDRAAGQDYEIGDTKLRYGRKSLTPEARDVAVWQGLGGVLVNMLALNASSDLNEQVDWAMQDLKRAAEMYRKIKSGEIDGSTEDGKRKILQFKFYMKDNASELKEIRDAKKELTKFLDKLQREAGPPAKKKESGKTDEQKAALFAPYK